MLQYPTDSLRRSPSYLSVKIVRPGGGNVFYVYENDSQ